MERPNYRITKRRAVALVMAIVIIFTGYSARLFQIEIVEGSKYSEIADSSATVKVPIAASRGEILDRYFRPLAVNRTSFSIIFDYSSFPHGSSDEDQKRENDIILALTNLLTKQGNTWNDTLPISTTSPYSFLQNRDKSIAYLKSTSMLRMADYATASQCMSALVKHYNLSGYTQAEQRIIAGIRYEIEIRGFSLTNSFTFSTDVSQDTYNIILEHSSAYPGVNVQTSAVRDYVSGTTAPHLIGTVGPIYAEEYKSLKDQGYLLSDTVGKSGIESAMESSLRGKDGTSTITKNSDGTVIDKAVTTEPVAGSSVILTLDSNLQKKAQDALTETIQGLRSQGAGVAGQDVKSGSIVMLDIKTGGVLACASWPGFDLSTYKQNYNQLISDKDNPLFNRALNGTFAPGSTMKPCVALGALTEGAITTSTTISCHYTYDRFDTMHCWDHYGHGPTDVVKAIQQSCDVFFYEVGWRLGITKLDSYASAFGLGQKTGIEVGESSGVLAGPTHSEAVGSIWYGGNTCQAAIGQSDNLFTPIQLATYAMTLANNGVRYKTHLVKSTISADGTQTEVKTQVASTVKLSQTAIDAVRKGMYEVTSTPSGTAYSMFRGAKYTVAGKTGTAEKTGHSDIGVFIGYAPVENPQVAISVVLEYGGSHPSTELARKMLDAYFSTKTENVSPTPEGELLP